MSNYYIEASRLRSEVTENINNNAWEYKLNSGMKIPAGSTVQIMNAFVNKQGITGNSLEFSEDVNETFSVGFTVPQSAMFLQKPERTAKDDRLTTAALEDAPGSLGLQTPEISTVLTNYYDGMVNHNLTYSSGLELFNTFDQILTVENNAPGIDIEVGGDITAGMKVGLPVVIRKLTQRDATGAIVADMRSNPVVGYYMRVTAVTYDGGQDRTLITTDTGSTQFISVAGDFSNLATEPGTLYYPDIAIANNYSSMFGLAMINSLVGTKEDGETYYRQTKLAKQDFAYENADVVPPLENQIDDINYQAGINSDIPSEEFRKAIADPTRDVIWNAQQTSQDKYEFDRASYNFYFAPAQYDYDVANTRVNFSAFKSPFPDYYQINNPGLNGHTLKMNANGMTIGRTGDKPMEKYHAEEQTSTSDFYPFIDAIPHTEYPGRLDLSIPRPAQPAKYKDTYSSQIDYLRNGFSWDAAPSRVEIFTAKDSEMINYGGAQNPFQPNIYQDREGQAVTETTLKTLDSCKFLDRVILSQTQIGGLYNRDDSAPYVKRTVNITNQSFNLNEEKNNIHVGTVIVGVIDSGNQSVEVRETLFPQVPLTGELDEAPNLNKIRIPCVIRAYTGGGAGSVTITDIEPITNLKINGAVLTEFTMVINDRLPDYQGIVVGDQVTIADAEAYKTLAITFEMTITSETTVGQQPQMMPIFSAKGAFSELKGDIESNNVASDNDIDLGGGDTCRFNYFMDTMHDQGQLDVNKVIGEDFYQNPSVTQNFDDFNGANLFRVASTPAFNSLATASGQRDNLSDQKRIFLRQRSNLVSGGIHPRRAIDETGTNPVDSFTKNIKNIQNANYLFGSTAHCSAGSMRPPIDKSFAEGQVVMKVPTDTNGDPVPENNGLTALHSDLASFDPDDSTNVIKIKNTTQRESNTVPIGIKPLQPIDAVTNPAVAQADPLGDKNTDITPNCGSALGDYEAYPYSTPQYDMMDTGGTGDDLCLVQLQALVDDRDNNYGDYVLRPLTSDIEIEIPKGVYTIPGFLDLFNGQVKDLDVNDTEELANIDNFKTVRKFQPLGGNALTGGQVTLLNDFNASTHARTIFSTDEDSEFVSNPLVIAVSVPVYNDIVRAWQMCGGDARLVSYYLAQNDTTENPYHNTTAGITIGGGSYVWKNFRDKFYWSEFVDKYSDNIENLIGDTEADDIVNHDTQFYFAIHRNGDDAVGTPNNYGAQAVLGTGDGGQAVADPSLDSQSLISGATVPQIDKIRKYNSVRRGIYVGSPDFELTYDSDEQLFALDGLHYSFRNPSVDLTGESAFSADDEGQKAVLYRSLSELIQGDYSINGVSAELPTHIVNALQKPLDQISGVFIFNMAKTTSITESDFTDENSSNIGRTFNDYFTSSLQAKAAWAKTFWSRLGFSYRTFNTRNTNNFASYYFKPIDTTTNIEDGTYITNQPQYLQDQTTDSVKSVKLRSREVYVVEYDAPETDYNNVGKNIEDNYLPGVKTNSVFDIRSIPTLASIPGINEGAQNELVRLFNNASISTIRSMSGGYVYYPMKLGAPDTFDVSVNYTAQNISPSSEGWVFQSRKQGVANIVSKSGAAIPAGEQLVYLRSWKMAPTAIAGYKPTSFYDKTASQPVAAPAYPVAYEWTNDQFLCNTPFRFAQESQFNISNGVYRDRTFNLNGSMFLASQSTPITSQSDTLLADNLPVLNPDGHYIVTSDIVKSLDSINGEDQLPILGVVPISSLSSQDFIVSFGDLIHSINQDTVINSIKIEILNPDLTPPFLQPNSTIIIQVTIPELGIPPAIKDKKSTSKKVEQEVAAGQGVA